MKKLLVLLAAHPAAPALSLETATVFQSAAGVLSATSHCIAEKILKYIPQSQGVI